MAGSLVTPGGGTIAPAESNSLTTSGKFPRIAKTMGVQPVFMSIISPIPFPVHTKDIPRISNCSRPLDKTALTSSKFPPAHARCNSSSP